MKFTALSSSSYSYRFRLFPATASSASLPARRRTAPRVDRGDSDSLPPCGCCCTREHPTHRREDTRDLLRRETTRDRKTSCTIARAYFMAHPKGGMRTYNAACGDESTLKS